MVALLVSRALFALLAAGSLQAETPSELLNTQLPKWVRFGFEHRFRVESYNALRYNINNDDHWLLNRLRVNLTLQPTSWWSINFQGQDARIFFKENPAGAVAYTNRSDLRLAYAEFGDAAQGKFALRVGRQELGYGEERVLGASNWSAISRSFDAVKLIARQGPLQLDLFAASVVTPRQRGLSHHVQGNNLHGAYLKWTNPLPGITIEPYFLWRTGNGRGDVVGGTGHLDRRIAGLRSAGKLPTSFDYSTEFVYQTGTVGASAIQANALHAMLRHTFAQTRWMPRWIAEFNHASGDKTPGDGKSGTFDQLYPTSHEKTGLADQVGWQNINHIATGFDVAPRKRLLVRAMIRSWRLSQARDGVYLTNGSLVYRDSTGATGKHVGEECDIVAVYTFAPHYVSAGFGHLFPGEFLRRFSNGAGLNYVYLNVGYRF